MDLYRLRAVRGLPPDGLVPRVFGGLFRRPARGDERRVAGDGSRAAAPQLSKLVPADLSLCVRHVPLRGRGPVADERIKVTPAVVATRRHGPAGVGRPA